MSGIRAANQLSLSPAVCSEATDEAAHLVVIANEEHFQGLRMGAEQKADFQPRPAFKYVLLQPADRDSCMKAWLAEAFGQDSQCLFRSCHIRVAQGLEGGEKARAEQDGGFSHVLAFP